MFVQALQTMPGIDQRSAAMLLVAIGVAMNAFGTAQRLAGQGFAQQTTNQQVNILAASNAKATLMHGACSVNVLMQLVERAVLCRSNANPCWFDEVARERLCFGTQTTKGDVCIAITW